MKQLPGGGTTIFPRYRLMGYVGYPGSSALGRLGTGNLDSRVAELTKRGASYTDGRKLMPVMELITVTVRAEPGADGLWRTRAPDSVISTYLNEARKRHAMLLLDIQPGRSDFPTEVAALRHWLLQPDVGLALDPEWRMHAGQIPGRSYGWVTGSELDQVGKYVSQLVAENHLPQKAIVYHQVARTVVRSEDEMHNRSGVAWIKSVDGIGTPPEKISTYKLVNKSTPKFVHAGFKLFFEEDQRGGSPLMTPRQVMALHPTPEYVMYE